MTITSGPWPHPDPQRSSLSLVEIPAPLLHELARGAAPEGGEFGLTPYLLDEECAGLWRMRSEQITRSPSDAPWVTRFVVVRGAAEPVGLAGFHGPPTPEGRVEVGYRIDPAQRRRGYARQALETMLAVSHAHPDVQLVRASISPDNDASRALVQGYGFIEVGQQWDDEDGLEILFEAPA